MIDVLTIDDIKKLDTMKEPNQKKSNGIARPIARGVGREQASTNVYQ